MSNIRILPENLSNKIAAGEVVERPASVVKELVENSLDAGSTRIVIEIEKGGRSLIQVTDNGSGMSRDDALLSIERYATSKLYSDNDLFSIHTLGFRGEALPSIASVSRLQIVTREPDAASGVKLILEGGKLIHACEAGSPAGTQITVRNLFYNTPARLKFLKTLSTELGHISDVVSTLSLGWPQVHFKLIHNGSVLQNRSAVQDSAERVADILRLDHSPDIIPVHLDENGISISGWISHPRMTRKSALGIYSFVNGRPVRNRMMQHALLEAYSERLMRGQFPVAVLYLTLPCEEVDVNVHPAKQEVRFFRHRQVYETIITAVKNVLYCGEKPSSAVSLSRTDECGHRSPVPDPSTPSRNEHPNSFHVANHAESAVPLSVSEPSATFGRSQPVQPEIWKTSPSLRPIGQFFQSYILCESDSHLILFDQHAAHERIVYERLASQSKDRHLPVQRLLIPETVELGYRQADILEKLIPELNCHGLEIELFGNRSFVIKSVPALLSGREIIPVIIEMVDSVIETGLAGNMEKSLDECLKRMACHSAIRANRSLTIGEMITVITDLQACRVPGHCPHGRPTWIEWSKQEIETLFGRI